MKKFLLFSISFYALISSLAAQNWRPFNPNDTIRHYLAEDSVGNSFTADRLNPMITLMVNTSITQNNVKTLSLNRGYSQLENSDPSNASRVYPVLSRILGNKIEFKIDTTEITASNSVSGFNYYKLYFPTNLPNISFELGRTDSTVFHAIVDSTYQMSIPNYGMDSVKRLSISTSAIYPASPYSTVFNGAKIELSKNNGLLRTIDFSSLEKVNYYTLYSFQDTNTVFTNREHYLFDSGDEIHYINSYNLTGPGSSSGYENVKVKILSKQVRNDSLVGTYQYTSIPFYVSLNPVSEVRSYSIALSDTIIDNLASQVYLNSNQFLFCFQSGSLYSEYFAIDESETNYMLSFVSKQGQNHQFSATCDSVNTSSGGLSGNYKIRRIGVGFPSFPFDYESYGIGGVGTASQSRMVAFATIQGDTIGSPLNFSTSLKDLGSHQNDFTIYPNPVKDNLNFTNATQIKLLKLFDQNGRLVLEEKSPQSELRLTNLPSALYFIQIEMQSGELINHKLIKQ
tara:strand:+ start:23737 stop:25269 length:1533 start_codon:yes stop_codon:yes gene_type:complete